MFLNLFLGFFLVLAFGMLFLVFSELVAFVRTRVPFVPTSAADVKFISERLNLSANDTVYDLGSGNGKVVFLLEKLSGTRAKGFELGWWTYLYARLKAWVINSRVEFAHRNFFKEDWSGASVIYCYLYPPLMGRIEEKFMAECRPGSRAVVRDFPLPNLPYEQKYYLPHNHEIYIYKI